MPSSGADRWSVWFDLDPRPGPLNMAIDQALLERAGRHGERWLRLYRWSPHCLSFGRHERAARRYDRGWHRYLRSLTISCVRSLLQDDPGFLDERIDRLPPHALRELVDAIRTRRPTQPRDAALRALGADGQVESQTV